MKIGGAFHATDVAICPVELPREAESRGLHSLQVPQLTHIPSSRRTPTPTGAPELADEDGRRPDPEVTIGAVETELVAHWITR